MREYYQSLGDTITDGLIRECYSNHSSPCRIHRFIFRGLFRTIPTDQKVYKSL